MRAGDAFPIYPDADSGAVPRITSLLIKPVSAVCNLDCKYCFYLDRAADPYQALPGRAMNDEVLERLVDTYVFYAHPTAVFVFQGGEPTLAGLGFYERLVELQKERGRAGLSVSNAIQTNGVLLDADWCRLFREYHWLVGVSLDGPEAVHDLYRPNKAGQGTWRKVIRGVETLQANQAEFNILCVVSKANVGKARELYRFFRSLGIENLQFIPLAEFDGAGDPLEFTIAPNEYGRFLLELFDAWWPDRRKVRIRFFDNIAEALAGQRPGNCTMHTTCDSYAVIEYNGDVYPCDFFVEKEWKLGNVLVDSWSEIARRQKRYRFAANKTLPHPVCEVCEYQTICHGGCPKLRKGPHGRFEDLDYFCPAYKMIYARATGPLRRELRTLLGRDLPEAKIR
jgi:uncharacterized protein